MKKSHIARSVPQDDTPLRHLPLVDLLVDTRAELLELVTRSGLKVLGAMLEEDRTAVCSPRYAHEPDLVAAPIATGSGCGSLDPLSWLLVCRRCYASQDRVSARSSGSRRTASAHSPS
jgi:hypothetical protein